jgi:hypothetical protein
LNLVKKTKSGEREIDITALINSVCAEYDKQSGGIRIKAVLSAGSDNFLNPEMLITALKSRVGIMSGDPMQENYSIVRTKALTKEMKEFK